jgi:hypothetical protein
MDIRDSEEITADQVLILFFERKGLEVNVSPMTIDNNGNLTQAPPTYRKFFLAEERRFLDTQH